MGDQGGGILLIGIGNPASTDDGLGRELADRVESRAPSGVRVLSDYQLQPEWAADFQGCRAVVIADADLGCRAAFRLSPVAPEVAASFSSHSLSPAALAGLARQLFGAAPTCYVLGIRPYDLTRFREGLTPEAEANLNAALAFLLPLLDDAGALATAAEPEAEDTAANR